MTPSRETCRHAEIGYALVAFAFGELNLNRLEADIDPRNSASAASLARLGFTREGLLRERWIFDAEVSDTALYGLLRREWLARAATNETNAAPV